MRRGREGAVIALVMLAGVALAQQALPPTIVDDDNDALRPCAAVCELPERPDLDILWARLEFVDGSVRATLAIADLQSFSIVPAEDECGDCAWVVGFDSPNGTIVLGAVSRVDFGDEVQIFFDAERFQEYSPNASREPPIQPPSGGVQDPPRARGEFQPGRPALWTFILDERWAPNDSGPWSATFAETWRLDSGRNDPLSRVSGTWARTDRGPDEGFGSSFGPTSAAVDAASSPDPIASAWWRSPVVPLGVGLLALVGLAAVGMMRRRAAPGRPRYSFIRDLGEGSFGRAWLADDAVLGRRVVIKELYAERADARTRAALLREARVVASISHPNVVAVYDVEEAGASARIVMEYMAGGSLADRLRGGPLAEPAVIRLAHDLLEALDHVHARGIVHRDIKPANVLFTEEGRAKLADFGIASAPSGFETIVGPGRSAGTPLYMAPEQARGERVDARADLYALALVLHEAATGLSPRDAEIAPTLSPRLTPTIAKALAQAPEERYQTAAEMKGSLRAGGTRVAR